MTNQNLLCPFCGSEPVDFTEHIECANSSCDAYGMAINHKKWNTRPPHPLEKKVEEFMDKMIEMFEYDIRDIELEFNRIFGEE